MSEALFEAWQRDDDVLTYNVDFTGWLGSETIASVVRETSGTVVTGASNTTTAMSQRLNKQGWIDLKIVTSGTQTKQIRIMIRQRSEDSAATLNLYPNE